MLALGLFLLALNPLATALELPDHVVGLAARGHNSSCSGPLTLTPAFTFTLGLPPLLPPIHPTNSNGTFAVIPDTGGTISGPLLNGVITAGIGWAPRFSTYYFEESVNYGQTEDGEPFFFRNTGLGNSLGKVDRLVSIREPSLSPRA